MAGTSAIEWTGGTWNVVTGCTKVSPGCAHCYIERTIPFRTAGRRFELVDGESTTGVQLHPERLEPSHNLYPTRLDDPIFVCSLADLFHDDVDFRFLAEVFAVMALCTDRTFQVLTKRPERMRELLADPLWWACVEGAAQRRHEEATGEDVSYTMAIHGPLPNVWLGVSIENARYTWRADVLREIPAAIRFLSCEPLLGSLFKAPSAGRRDDVDAARRLARPASDAEGLTLTEALAPRGVAPLNLEGIDWVIVGGESGPKARPMRLEWAREIVQACYEAAGVECCGQPAVEYQCCGNVLPSGECCAAIHGGYYMQPVEQCCGQPVPSGPRPAIFVKQLGAKPVETHPYIAGVATAYSHLKLRDRKGGDWDEWPRDLRIREFPERQAVPA